MVATTRESVPKTTVRAMVIWSFSDNPPEDDDGLALAMFVVSGKVVVTVNWGRACIPRQAFQQYEMVF
jgi:hypothetical protein